MADDGNSERRLGEMLTRAESGHTTQVDVKKVGHGAFNTKGDSWLNSVVRNFIEDSNLKSAVDPFAGQGDLLKVCEGTLQMEISGFDIQKELGLSLIHI